MRRWAIALLALLFAGGADAQEGVRVGVDPAVVTVGEPFRVVVEWSGPAAALELAVAPDSAGVFEARGGRGSDPAARVAWVGVVAWRPGAAGNLHGTLRVTAAGGETRSVPVVLPTPVVRSVLPADSGVLPPRPARDVVGPDRALRWGLVFAAAALGLVLLALLLGRRRRPPPAVRPAPGDVRREALRRLDAARAAGYLDRGEAGRFLEATAEAVRWYAAGSSAELGRDLTTHELLLRLRQRAAPGLPALAEVLEVADRAKFAGDAPAPGVALREWELARAWVAGDGKEPAP